MRVRGVPYDDLADAGRAVAAALREVQVELGNGAVVLAVLPGGAPVARVVATELKLPVVAVRVTRDPEGASATLVGTSPESLAGRTLVIVDDGVESGVAAHAAVTLAKSLDPQQLVFAVPVCHAQAAADLIPRVDVLVSPHRPFTPRALRWEYKVFAPPATEAEALRILEPLGLE